MDNYSSTRYYNYDLLRVLCTFFIVLMHVNSWFYLQNINAEASLHFLSQSTIHAITQVAVPCFVMLSGAFILNKYPQQSFVTFLSHTIVKIVVPFLAVYLLWFILLFCKALLFTHEYSHICSVMIKTPSVLWFVPMLMGCYLLTPLIVKIRETWPSSYCIIAVLLLAWSVVSSFTTTTYVPYSIHSVISFLPYYMLGDLIFRSNYKVRIGWLIILYLISLIITLFIQVNTDYNVGNVYKVNLSPSIVIMSIIFFMIFKELSVKKNVFVNFISQKSYFIYLFHGFFLPEIVFKYFLGVSNHQLVSILIITLIVFCLSTLLSSVCGYLYDLVIKKYKFEEYFNTLLAKIVPNSIK